VAVPSADPAGSVVSNSDLGPEASAPHLSRVPGGSVLGKPIAEAHPEAVKRRSA